MTAFFICFHIYSYISLYDLSLDDCILEQSITGAIYWMSEDSDPRRFGPGPSSDFREDSAQQVRRFGPEGEKIRPRLYYIVFLSKNT